MRIRMIATLAGVCMFAAGAYAQCTDSAKAKEGAGCTNAAKTASSTCSGAAVAKTVGGTCSAKSECSPSAKKAMGMIPKMAYAVGDKTTCCPEEAKKLAGDSGSIRFVVGEERFDQKPAAMEAYAKLLRNTLTDITSVKYAVGDACVPCPDSAKAMAAKEKKDVVYRVASFDFKCAEMAEKAAVQAREAAGKVAMKMLVGDKEFCCTQTAADVAKAESKQVEYVVGDQATPCDIDAAVKLAQARLEAAILALDSATSGEEAKVASAG